MPWSTYIRLRVTSQRVCTCVCVGIGRLKPVIKSKLESVPIRVCASNTVARVDLLVFEKVSEGNRQSLNNKTD